MNLNPLNSSTVLSFSALLEMALAKYMYVQCSRCAKAYFGGDARCQQELEAAGLAEKAFDPAELVCGSCAAEEAGNSGLFGVCGRHGTDFLEFKCRFCCSVAMYFWSVKIVSSFTFCLLPALAAPISVLPAMAISNALWACQNTLCPNVRLVPEANNCLTASNALSMLRIHRQAKNLRWAAAFAGICIHFRKQPILMISSFIKPIKRVLLHQIMNDLNKNFIILLLDKFIGKLALK